MSTEEVDLLAELAVMNGYSMQDSVLVFYTYGNTVKRRRISLSESLGKMQLKLDKDPRTVGIDFKIIL